MIWFSFVKWCAFPSVKAHQYLSVSSFVLLHFRASWGETSGQDLLGTCGEEEARLLHIYDCNTACFQQVVSNSKPVVFKQYVPIQIWSHEHEEVVGRECVDETEDAGEQYDKCTDTPGEGEVPQERTEGKKLQNIKERLNDRSQK